MENTNYSPPMLLELVAAGVFAEEPFMLVDVGCGLGLDPAWRLFGDHLHALGFDAQVAEVERLRAQEENPNVHYHAALIGLPEEPSAAPEDPYFDPFPRTSSVAAVKLVRSRGTGTFLETNDWRGLELASEAVGLADFLRSEGVDSIDFVKSDTDGGDLQVLRSFEDMIRPSAVLGFMVETPFTGSAAEGVHTFHNVDPLLKGHGFLLGTLSVHRYSRAALPAPFEYELLGSTIWGQPQWGDLVYLRDAAAPGYARFGDLSPVKLLKLACLYELFKVPDCAVEILLSHRDRLSSLVDVDRLLDLLTPPLDGREVGYREYVAAFEEDPTRFYPAQEEEQEEEPDEEGEVEPPRDPTLVERARHRVARVIGR